MAVEIVEFDILLKYSRRKKVRDLPKASQGTEQKLPKTFALTRIRTQALRHKRATLLSIQRYGRYAIDKVCLPSGNISVHDMPE